MKIVATSLTILTYFSYSYIQRIHSDESNSKIIKAVNIPNLQKHSNKQKMGNSLCTSEQVIKTQKKNIFKSRDKYLSNKKLADLTRSTKECEIVLSHC